MPVSKCKNSKIVSEAATDILLFLHARRAVTIVQKAGPVDKSRVRRWRPLARSYVNTLAAAHTSCLQSRLA